MFMDLEAFDQRFDRVVALADRYLDLLQKRLDFEMERDNRMVEQFEHRKQQDQLKAQLLAESVKFKP